MFDSSVFLRISQFCSVLDLNEAPVPHDLLPGEPGRSREGFQMLIWQVSRRAVLPRLKYTLRGGERTRCTGPWWLSRLGGRADGEGGASPLPCLYSTDRPVAPTRRPPVFLNSCRSGSRSPPGLRPPQSHLRCSNSCCSSSRSQPQGAGAVRGDMRWTGTSGARAPKVRSPREICARGI